MTSGLLDELIDAAMRHTQLHPDRLHVEPLVKRLRALRSAWADRLSRADEVAAADPHSAVLHWQAGAGLPELHGSPRQVRWAERIRFDYAQQPDMNEVVSGETDARVWIGLYTRYR